MRRLTRALRSPKGYATVALLLLAVVAGSRSGWVAVGTGLLIAVGSALATDLLVGLLARRRVAWPSGALVTGLIVALVLDPSAPPLAFAVAGVTGVASKHLLRVRNGHVFNPAAVGLLVVAIVLGAPSSWWGALPSLPVPWVLLVLLVGAVITDRVSRTAAVLTYLSTYFAIFTLDAVFFGAGRLGEVYRPPFVNATLFCAFLMITDPPTSPARRTWQAWYGAAAAIASFAVFQLWSSQAFLVAGLLLANLTSVVRGGFLLARDRDSDRAHEGTAAPVRR